jgi:hypothetical protein
MRTIRRTTLILTTLLAASSGTFPLHAQEAQLAQLRSTSGLPLTSLAAEPISDDGDDLSSLHPASQLLITFTGTGAGLVSVKVFNEAGELVLERSTPVRPGRQFLPIDVDGLASGRYLVRVQEGAAVSTSRFLRP